MSRFNPISKYSRNWPRSLHLNIIRWPCGWASADIFPGGGQSRYFPYVFLVVVDATQLTYTKKKMSNVTATVAHSVFIVGKLCTEQMFVLVSMGILRLSYQSSKW